jgi:hypothetical protein
MSTCFGSLLLTTELEDPTQSVTPPDLSSVAADDVSLDNFFFFPLL